MLVTNELDEYAALIALINYCKNHVDCEGCKLADVCDCFAVSPENLDVRYIKTRKNKNEER